MVDVPTIEPTQFVAGDTVKWTRELADYSAAAGWVLTYALRNASAAVNVTASGSGTTHSVTISAATTIGIAPGSYSWAAYVTNAGLSERYEIGRGTLEVLPNLADAAPQDMRSQAAKAVDDLRAALATFRSSSGRIRRYRIGDREMEFETIADMLRLLSHWTRQLESETAADRIAQGLGSKTRVQVRF